jgi:DNA-binding CsgD family transcriptional regulator
MPETSARHAAPPDIPPRTQTQILWDSLADFDAARVDAALDYLMQGLCALVDARNAVWSGLARLGDAQGDPASGWRPRSVRFLHSTEKLLASIRAQTERMDLHFANDAVAAIATQAGLFRAHGQPPFRAQDRDTVAYALRGIKWFHRQLLLSHGLLVAGTPLTDAERSVLQSLLSGKTEKQIAAELGQSPNTTHGHVTALYRKFGVSNRPALMALWLGQGV